MRLTRILELGSAWLLALMATGCASLPQGANYPGPARRTASVEGYYRVQDESVAYSESVVRTEQDYTLKTIELETYLGPSKVDYFQRHEPSDSIIFVFPILGGRNALSNYFAEYFAKHGFDTAVIHRHSDFKRPENFYRIEEILRNNVICDRLVISFFEDHYNKSEFGTFGLSRGGINVAITAGIDDRLKYNVIAMGGEDLVNILKNSREKGIVRYRKRVLKKFNVSEEEFYAILKEQIRTDPKYVAPYIDARNTLMFISMFDACVPTKYGLKLRETIGQPSTVFLLSGHLSGIAFTQVVPLVPPLGPICLFPLDYVETESLTFYRKSFDSGRSGIKALAYRILHLPFAVAKVSMDKLFGGEPDAVVPAMVFVEAEQKHEEVAD